MSSDLIVRPPDDGEPPKLPIQFIEEKPQDVLARFPGLSKQAFTDKQKTTLEQQIPPDDIDILPTGELYVSQVRYRRILNDAFGAGGWGLVPTGDFQQDGGTLCREYSLFAEGRFISSAIGEADFQPNNPRYSKATAAESLKSNALTRCCKDLLVASECWDKRFCEGWKKKNAVAVWCTGKAGDIAGKKKKLWRRRDADRFEYPWEEQGTPPPPEPDPADDVPTVDVRADAEAGSPVPQPAPISPLDGNQATKKDYAFLREAGRQRARVGRDAYYRVLGAHGREHATEVYDRDEKKVIYREWQALPNHDAGKEGEP